MGRIIFQAGLFSAVLAAVTGCGGGASTESGSVAAAPKAADWDYLQSEYGDFLSKKCGDSADPGGVWAACAGLLNAEMDAFQRDVETLPMSKSRAAVLEAIADYKADYAKWQTNQCGSVESQPAADVVAKVESGVLPLQISFRHGAISATVKREAEK
jgi:hypothetical protein